VVQVFKCGNDGFYYSAFFYRAGLSTRAIYPESFGLGEQYFRTSFTPVLSELLHTLNRLAGPSSSSHKSVNHASPIRNYPLEQISYYTDGSNNTYSSRKRGCPFHQEI
jgi:hypothetical protein